MGKESSEPDVIRLFDNHRCFNLIPNITLTISSVKAMYSHTPLLAVELCQPISLWHSARQSLFCRIMYGRCRLYLSPDICYNQYHQVGSVLYKCRTVSQQSPVMSIGNKQAVYNSHQIYFHYPHLMNVDDIDTRQSLVYPVGFYLADIIWYR